MSISRYTSRHPMFFYQQVKNRRDERIKDNVGDIHAGFVCAINWLVERGHMREAARLAQASMSFYHLVLRSELFALQTLHRYEQQYTNRRGKFYALLKSKSKNSKACYNNYGDFGNMIVNGLVMTNALLIISGIVLSATYVHEKKSVGTCFTQDGCDLKNTDEQKTSTAWTASMIMQWIGACLISGMILSVALKLTIDKYYESSSGAYHRYKGKLFTSSSTGKSKEQKMLDAEDDLANDFANLLTFEDEYYGRNAVPLIVKPN